MISGVEGTGAPNPRQAPGVYIVRLATGQATVVRRVTVAR